MSSDAPIYYDPQPSFYSHDAPPDSEHNSESQLLMETIAGAPEQVTDSTFVSTSTLLSDAGWSPPHHTAALAPASPFVDFHVPGTHTTTSFWQDQNDALIAGDDSNLVDFWKSPMPQVCLSPLL